MATSRNVNFTLIPVPNTPFNGDIAELLSLLASHLTGTLDNGAFLGQSGGTEPMTDIGIWLNGFTWEGWSDLDGKYLPFPVKAGAINNGVLYTTTLQSGAASADITLNLPDEDGQTLATLINVFTPTPTKTVTGGAIGIDWSAHTRYYGVLNANATISDSVAPTDGQIVDIWLENPASATWTVTWPATDVPVGGSFPTQTVGTSGHRKIDHYRRFCVGTTVFLEKVQNFDIATSGGDVTPPVVSTITMTSGTANIVIAFNELLQGATLSVSDFIIKKNGVVQTILTAASSGFNVNLQLSSAITTGNTVTVQYTGSSIKDTAGNVAAVFGPSACTVNATPQGGSGGGGGGSGGGYLA